MNFYSFFRGLGEEQSLTNSYENKNLTNKKIMLGYLYVKLCAILNKFFLRISTEICCGFSNFVL